jgi:FkbM family methyltransferase
MNLEEYERIQPNTVVDGLIFNLPNRHVQWRVETMYTKEPDTVEWIRSLPAGEVFYDVGANIGLYTMLAAKQGLRVYAFEPEAQNYAVLIRNLAMNKFPKATAVAFPFCLSDGQFVDTLRLSSLTPGGSCHSFASDKNYKMVEKEWAYEQGSVSFSLDSLIFEIGMPQPQHIKVDVDGFENKVIYGAARTLENVRTILVELDSGNSEHMEIKARLEGMGFVTDDAQITAARRADGPFKGIGNIIFKRPVEVQDEPAQEVAVSDSAELQS